MSQSGDCKTQDVCAGCCESLGPGPKLRRFLCPLLYCDRCARARFNETDLLVRQYGWDEQCSICVDAQPAAVYLACHNHPVRPGDCGVLTGHSICPDCCLQMDIKRVPESCRWYLPEHPIQCPWCKQTMRHPIKAPADFIVIPDDPEIIAIPDDPEIIVIPDDPVIERVLDVKLVKRGKRKVKVVLAGGGVRWVDFEDLKEERLEESALIRFENKYRI